MDKELTKKDKVPSVPTRSLTKRILIKLLKPTKTKVSIFLLLAASSYIGNPVNFVFNLINYGWKDLEEDSTDAQDVYKLYEPKDPKVNVIFVHGLDGHHYKTWERKFFKEKVEEKPLNPTSGSISPSSVIPSNSTAPDSLNFIHKSKYLEHLNLPRILAENSDYPARIFTLKHNSKLFSNWDENQMPVQNIAANYLESLKSIEGIRDRPIVFVTHSLGGIIVKELLCQDADNKSDPIFDNVPIGAVFLGTPHYGTPLFAQHPPFCEKYLPRLDFVRNYLSRECDYLMDLSKRFCNLIDNNPERIELHYFAEQNPLLKFAIVDEFSAFPADEILIKDTQIKRKNIRSTITVQGKNHLSIVE